MTLSRFFLLALAAPTIAFAASPKTFIELVNFLVTIMNNVIATLIIAALVIYFFGIARQISKSGEGDNAQRRKFLIMGIVVIFVMVSVWGILEILRSAFLSGSLMSGGSGGTTLEVNCGIDEFGDTSCGQE